ncbi:type VII secretion target [Mycobacterium sp. G7A2]|uniref:type VII secretion target n=1 Tax=Mycobacterium sp. G7A2 TaxID=3317307 RepID=UPI0035A92160
MGSAGATRVDTAGLRAMAREYDTASAIIDAAVRNQLGSLRFGAALSGRAYAAHGGELATALAELSTALRLWSRAAAEIAVALQNSAIRYGAAADRSADQIAAHG